MNLVSCGFWGGGTALATTAAAETAGLLVYKIIKKSPGEFPSSTMNAPAGYWGTPTATTNFCEPDYEYSHYLAEFFNALSSVPLALCGLSGLLLCRRQRLGHEQWLAYAAVMTIGVGSVAFHATLLRTGQACDVFRVLVFASVSPMVCVAGAR